MTPAPDQGPKARKHAPHANTGKKTQARGGGQPKRTAAERRSAEIAGQRTVSPRTVAYEVLRDVDESDAYANLVLAQRIRSAGLAGLDAAFVTELVGGTLRNRGRYDRIIELAAGRDITEIDPTPRTVLRLGVHQLLGMRVSDHAAVNESVELQRRVGTQSASGFVNGVLRRVSRLEAEAWFDEIDEHAESADQALAQVYSHPEWIIRAMRTALRQEGREDELLALLVANNASPEVNLALLPGLTEPGFEMPEGVSVVGPAPTGAVLDGGNPGRVVGAGRGYPAGALRVQDQGSQLAALALSRARPIEAGERWLDLCAGPGGKTALLGAEARLAGGSVRANELAPHRAALVRDAVRAVADTVEVVSHDGRSDEAYAGERYDRILVDAPCTGLGALRRRPEARWRKQPEDVPGLTRLQGELLDAAVAHLKPGGLLAYVTCSPHPAETRVVVDRMLGRNPGLEELSARDALAPVTRGGALDLGGDTPSVQLWPHRHGTDAMFIALFRAPVG
ncbi:RsmB/NOP family class I SAM-dependent RNA methyltransferase [Leucobacter sp. M11]|uniref:RsmB/NOP family class I SAM-dependent RNA methyltransferase n=1 Tax=Leucobacter sp. M11 TaxID=2993565 RepID=UPI002D7F7130|nr:transcription antitermination factor NusB [Leucobacter sp. M11]MEB4616256.1 rRNA small subunit methyltransferase B [Leucobacter sp. M11]